MSTRRCVKYAWRLEIRPDARAAAVAQGFDIALQPVAGGAMALAEDPVPAAAGPSGVEALFGGNAAANPSNLRQAVGAMTAQQREAFVHFGSSLKKVVIAIICLVIAFEFVPPLIALFTNR